MALVVGTLQTLSNLFFLSISMTKTNKPKQGMWAGKAGGPRGQLGWKDRWADKAGGPGLL